MVSMAWVMQLYSIAFVKHFKNFFRQATEQFIIIIIERLVLVEVVHFMPFI